MSGVTPQCWLANMRPLRPMPDCTSSKINRMPCSSHSARSPARKPSGRHDVAALALDRLDQDRGDFRRRHAALEQHADVVEHRRALVGAGEQRPVRIRVRHVGDARHRREEALLLRVLARGEGERAHRAAVEAAEETDEARAAGDVARQLDRGLDRLGARLAQEAHRFPALHRRDAAPGVRPGRSSARASSRWRCAGTGRRRPSPPAPPADGHDRCCTRRCRRRSRGSGCRRRPRPACRVRATSRTGSRAGTTARSPARRARSVARAFGPGSSVRMWSLRMAGSRRS